MADRIGLQRGLHTPVHGKQREIGEIALIDLKYEDITLGQYTEPTRFIENGIGAGARLGRRGESITLRVIFEYINVYARKKD